MRVVLFELKTKNNAIMKKKIYTAPSLEIFKIQAPQQLLAGSDPNYGGGGKNTDDPDAPLFIDSDLDPTLF